MSRRIVRDVVRMSLVIVLTACQQDPTTELNPLERPPVETVRIESVEDAAGWAYQRSLVADVDGDGSEERIVIADDAEAGSDDHPLWEDGHRWAVFVESGRDRTLLYTAFVTGLRRRLSSRPRTATAALAFWSMNGLPPKYGYSL